MPKIKKDIGYWVKVIAIVIALSGLIGGYIDNKTDNILLKDQVERNKKRSIENEKRGVETDKVMIRVETKVDIIIEMINKLQ